MTENYFLDYRDIFFMTHNSTHDLASISTDIHRTGPKNNIHIAWLSPLNSFVPFQIVGAAHYIVGDKHLTERVDRDDFLIILTVNGEGCIIYEGKEYILVPNSFLLIDCRKPHKYFVRQGKSWEYKHIHFKTLFYNNLLDYVPTYFENCLDAFLIFDELVKYAYSRHANSSVSHLIYSNYIENILIAVINKYHKSSTTLKINQNPNSSFSKVIAYIQEHFNEEILLSDIVKNFNYTESYFIRKFRKYFNCTPHQYIIKYRLSKTYELIAKGETIESAALSCGFKSVSSFYYAAKKHKHSKK